MWERKKSFGIGVNGGVSLQPSRIEGEKTQPPT